MWLLLVHAVKVKQCGIMGIDLRTFILILGITHLMQVVVFTYQYIANRNIKGPGWWLMWSAAEVVGFSLVLLRSVPWFLPYSIIFQDIVIFTGTIFIYIGVLVFFEKKANWKIISVLWAGFVVLHLSFVFLKNDFTARSFIFPVFIALTSFLTAWNIQKFKSRNISLTANFNTVVFIIHGSVFVYRALGIGMGMPVAEVFSPSFFNFFPYLDALIMSLMWTFGFIMMLNQRLNSEILESKEHFELIFNTYPDAAIISRLSDGMFVDCNEGFTKITGYSKEDIANNTTISINLWKNPEDRLILVSNIIEKGYFENFETVFQKKDGSLLTGLVSAKKIMINGHPHLISVTRDITGRKSAEEEIRNKNEELHNLNAVKDKFFSIIAHDLRSPFHGFLGLTTLLAEDLPTLTATEIHKIAHALKKSATNLFSLLENLLNWSSMKQGLILFDPQRLPLFPLAQESIILMLEQASLKDIKLTCVIPEYIQIYADSNAIQTVFRNLVSNAVKYTSKGGVIIVSAKYITDNMVEVAVEDTGIGMNKELRDHLFQLDYNTNRKGTNGEPSTGLGLILCKDLIEKCRGKIWEESEEGKGSVFYFTIPSHP